jgi:membrane-bound serine protease (ClpP class)
MVIALSGAGFFAAAVIASRYFGAIPVLRSLRLEPPAASLASAASAASTTDAEFPTLVVGATGEAHTALRPGGKANIDGRLVDVVADSTFIDRGRPVEVVEIAGTRVVVREV